MVFYNCPRCGFSTPLRANMSRHLARKFSCQINLKNVSIQECFQTVLHAEKMSDNQTTTFLDDSDNQTTTNTIIFVLELL